MWGLTLRQGGFQRFLRYSAVGGGTFALDLLILAALMELTPAHLGLATSLAFLVAVSLNYALSRAFVFRGTKRSVGRGYFYFLLIAINASLVISFSVQLLTTKLHIHYLAARIVVATVVGLASYLLNLYLTFKVAGPTGSTSDERKPEHRGD